MKTLSKSEARIVVLLNEVIVLNERLLRSSQATITKSVDDRGRPLAGISVVSVSRARRVADAARRDANLARRRYREIVNS